MKSFKNFLTETGYTPKSEEIEIGLELDQLTEANLSKKTWVKTVALLLASRAKNQRTKVITAETTEDKLNALADLQLTAARLSTLNIATDLQDPSILKRFGSGR